MSQASTRIVSCRHFVSAVQAAIRTNFYQIDARGKPQEQIAIKFASRRIDALPRPRPLYEIFVYSPRVEGVHMRFGKVARGGIRWSDRPQDFRTEILGLVKAQQVKNAVIVPVGAKGGFVPKLLPRIVASGASARGGAGRRYRRLQAFHLHAARPHRQYRGSTASSPRTTSCAMTMMIPISWSPPTRAPRPFPIPPMPSPTSIISGLSDAFASGGSAGYDHKKMGITARGAWESVKRHFREMDVDIGTTAFTVAGIGDMSGDVFGNGDAAGKHHQADCRFRSPRHLHRSRPRPATQLRRAPAAVRSAALELAGL